MKSKQHLDPLFMDLKDVNELRRRILEEAHNSPYSIHLDAMKMYYDLQEIYWWDGFKRGIT